MIAAEIKLVACVAALAGAFALGWTANGWRVGTQLANIKTEQSDARAVRAEAVRVDEGKTAEKEQAHAATTIHIADTLTTQKASDSDLLRAELATARRLQLDAKQRAATYRAQAQADDAARSDLADKSAALDRQLAEGVGVVAELAGVVRQRDGEVRALCDQLNADARLSGDEADAACVGGSQ